MMRGSKAMAVAVRHPDGHLVVRREPLSKFLYDGWLSRTPFLRGLVLLWDALGLGMRSLLFSSNVALEAEALHGEKGTGESRAADADGGETPAFEGPLAWGTVALSLGLGVGLFFLLPAFTADLIEQWLGIESPLLGNLVEGTIRLLLLIGYIWVIGFIPDIARVFAYHGAEHKTIMAYEGGAELEPDVVSGCTMYHPRCGTGFLLTVVVISILIFSLVGRPSLLIRLASRIALIPVVAGLAYEFIRYSGKHQHIALVRLVTKPNLWLQRLTTREPDETMLQTAITALRLVLEAERRGDVQPETMTVVQPQ